MKKFLSLFPYLLLAFSIFFNLYFLSPELSIKSEVNDNVFAYGLILRMDKAWDEGSCPLSLNCLPSLLDHWVSAWAMGYPLPHFYQHIPDLTVVIIYNFLNLFSKIPLFTVFQYFKYLMLSLIPLSYFISAKKFGLSNLTAGFTSLVATQISTQYLYGTDYNSLVWRGSGMFTQLWGVFFLPLAVSSIYRYLISSSLNTCLPAGRAKYKILDTNFLLSIIFLALVISSHVVFGFIALGSSLFIPIILSLSEKFSLKKLICYYKRLLLTFAFCLLTLSYWLIPLLQNSPLRNKSIWDDLNKFDSFGFQQITKWFLNGDLFDANRLPVLTILVILGFFLSLYLWSKQKETINPQILNTKYYLLFPVLFIFWFLLYFGRKTWGPLIDIIPLMEDLHIHRLINGVHFAGIFIIGITLSYIIENFSSGATKGRSINFLERSFSTLDKEPVSTKKFDASCFASQRTKILITLLILIILIPVFKERKEYLEYNKKLIYDYNKLYDADFKDFQKVLSISGPPPTLNRVYAGRPGNWGGSFFVGGTKTYLELSQRGFDTVGFLPETWSLNSDIEQYFDENREDHYNVFNIGFVLAPTTQKFPDFVKLILEAGKYKLYKVESTHNFEPIESPLTLNVNKQTFLNPNVAWLKSAWPKNRLFPTILYNKNYQLSTINSQLITMLDSSTYKTPDGIFPLFSPNPFTAPEKLSIINYQLSIKNEVVTPSSYSADINCQLPALSGPVLSEPVPSVVEGAEGVEGSIVNCQLLLKATYHPYWTAKITDLKTNNSQLSTINMVSPSFMAIQVPQGTHKIEFTYQPPTSKKLLILVSTLSLVAVFTSCILGKQGQKKNNLHKRPQTP